MKIHYFILFILIFIILSPSHIFALERDFFLDKRFGVVHVGGNYPDRTIQQDFLIWGGVKAYKLGFNSIEIFIPSNMCFGNSNPAASSQYGPYQAQNKFCEPSPSKWPKAQSLTQFVEQPDVKELFSLPLTRFYLTAYPLSPSFRNSGGKIISGIPYTQTELAILKEEYYTFTKYLLQTYGQTNKTFAVMPMVTMDRWLSNRDLEDDENPRGCDDSDSAPQNRIDNMIAHFSAIASGMSQARAEVPNSQSKVYLTCEVNSVICPMENSNVKAAINSVVPQAGCDLVGYAGYELRTISYNRNDPSFITRTLNYMAQQTPDHPDFGNKNIVFSEVGLQEQRARESMFTWFTETFLPKILAWGVPHVQLWSLGSCKTFNPGPSEQNDPNDCTGMWMFRPDGSPSKLYRFLKDTYSHTCTCETSGVCSTDCNFDKSIGVNYSTPIKCSLPTSLFSSLPTATNKNSWCQRSQKTKGDANGDNKLTNLDYMYYVSSVNGGKIPVTVNTDFNGDGEVGAFDRTIIINSL